MASENYSESDMILGGDLQGAGDNETQSGGDWDRLFARERQ